MPHGRVSTTYLLVYRTAVTQQESQESHNSPDNKQALYTLMILVWAIFSWFDHSRGILNDIYGVLDKFVGPYVRLFRRLIPSLGGIDLSPFIAFIVLQVVVQFLIRMLAPLLILF